MAAMLSPEESSLSESHHHYTSVAPAQYQGGLESLTLAPVGLGVSPVGVGTWKGSVLRLQLSPTEPAYPQGSQTACAPCLERSCPHSSSHRGSSNHLQQV